MRRSYHFDDRRQPYALDMYIDTGSCGCQLVPSPRSGLDALGAYTVCRPHITRGSVRYPLVHGREGYSFVVRISTVVATKVAQEDHPLVPAAAGGVRSDGTGVLNMVPRAFWLIFPTGVGSNQSDLAVEATFGRCVLMCTPALPTSVHLGTPRWSRCLHI